MTNCCWCGEDLEEEKGRIIWISAIDGRHGHEWCIEKYDFKKKAGGRVGFHVKCEMCGSACAKFKKTEDGLILICGYCGNEDKFNDGDTL